MVAVAHIPGLTVGLLVACGVSGEGEGDGDTEERGSEEGTPK